MSPGPSRSLLENTELLSELIGLIYDAAGAPEFFPVFLERLSDTLELSAMTLGLSLFEDADRPVRGPAMSVGMGAEIFESYDDYVAVIDPFRTPLTQLENGVAVPFEQMVPDRQFVRSEFYNEFYARTGNRTGFASVFHRQGPGASFLFGHRAAGQPSWDDAELEFVRMLTPHLQRARMLGERLGTLTSSERIVDGVLDRLTLGLVFVDANGRFVSANARGEQVLREQDGLGLSQGRLVTGRVSETRALDAIIDGACATAERKAHATPLSLRLDRPSGRRGLEVMACPIDPDSEVWSDGRAAAFLVINDGEPELSGVARRLRDLYGLSDAEARLTAALASGATVKEWAAHRGVSVETVRWQLKQVFAKTGVSRQSDLLRLVLLGPALVS